MSGHIIVYGDDALAMQITNEFTDAGLSVVSSAPPPTYAGPELFPRLPSWRRPETTR